MKASKLKINAITLTLLGVLLLTPNAFAFNPNHVEFYTYGGFDAVDSAFKFIALIFSDSGYKGLFYTIMAASLFFAGATNYFRFLQGRQEGNILSWAGPVLIAFILFVAFVLPKGEVTVYDKVLNKQDTIGGIPIGITTVAGLTSEVGDGILQIIDTTSVDPDMDYENSAGGIGVLTIYNAVTHQLSIDTNFDRSVQRYIEDCYFFCLENGNCNLAELEDTQKSLSDQLSKAASPSNYTVYYDGSKPQGNVLSCRDDWNNYLRYTLNNTTSYRNIAREICEDAGVDASDVRAFQHCLDVTTTYLEQLYNGRYPSVTDNIYNFLEQDYIAQRIYAATVMSNSKVLANNEIITRGYSLGITMNSWIPTIRGVLIAFGLSLLPFLVLFLPTPFFKKILGAVFGVFLFMLSWLIADAVIHYFLVHEAKTLFSSVYTAHNVGYASFLIMNAPLAKAIAIWGYLRSLGIGLAAMVTAGVTKVGAYGLQQMAAGLEGAVEAGAIRGKEAIDTTEQGKIEEEIANSNAFRGIAGGYSYLQMKQMLEKEMSKRLGGTAAFKNNTDAFETAKNAESINAGMVNAEAKIANENGMTARDYGWNKGIEDATRDVTAWNNAGGSHALGLVEGINKGAAAKGELDAAHNNPQALENLIEKQSAYRVTGEMQKFKTFAQLTHKKDNIQTAEELARLQNRSLQNLSLTTRMAHNLLGPEAPAGLYSITTDKDGNIIQATAQNGVNISEVTDQGLRHIAMTDDGKVALDTTTAGTHAQINGDIGKYAQAVGLPSTFAKAIAGANGSLVVNGKQYTGTVTLSPEQEANVADILSLSRYGDKYKNAVKTLRWAAANGYSVDFTFTGIGNELSKAEVSRIDYGKTISATQTTTGSSVTLGKGFDTAIASHDWRRVYQLIRNALKNSSDRKAVVTAIGEHLSKLVGAHYSVSQGLSFTNTVGSGGHTGKSYYSDHSASKERIAHRSGNIGWQGSVGLGSHGEEADSLSVGAGQETGYTVQSMSKDTVGHRSDTVSQDTYSSATTDTFGSNLQLSNNVLLRNFEQQGNKIVGKNKDVDTEAKELTYLVADTYTAFTAAIGDKSVLSKAQSNAMDIDQQVENYNVIDTYANKYNDAFYKKQENVLDSLGAPKPSTTPETTSSGTTPESKPLKENATPEVKPSPKTSSTERIETEAVNAKPEPKPEIKVVEPNHQADKVQELSARQSVSPELKPTVANFETTRNLSTLNNTQPSQPTVDNNHPSIRSDIPNATGFSNEQRVQLTMSSSPFDQSSASNPQAANPNPNTQTVGHGFNFGDFKVKTHERSKNDMNEMLKNIEAMKGNSDLTPNPSQEDLVPHSSRGESEPEPSKDEDMTPTQSR